MRKDAVAEIQRDLTGLANPQMAEFALRFFKTGPGEYGEGDVFRGIRVPPLRRLAKEYKVLPVEDAELLLKSQFHEYRLLALFIMVGLFAKGDKSARGNIYRSYLRHTEFINNWDLVDASAPHIVGGYLWDEPRSPLYRLVTSRSLWERRIAIIATLYFIKRGEVGHTLKLAEALLDDDEDLIHKAAGWMLREVGKQNPGAQESFLEKHHRRMPRVMLRYAIEKFPEATRKRYLNSRPVRRNK